MTLCLVVGDTQIVLQIFKLADHTDVNSTERSDMTLGYLSPPRCAKELSGIHNSVHIEVVNGGVVAKGHLLVCLSVALPISVFLSQPADENDVLSWFPDVTIRTAF